MWEQHAAVVYVFYNTLQHYFFSMITQHTNPDVMQEEVLKNIKNPIPSTCYPLLAKEYIQEVLTCKYSKLLLCEILGMLSTAYVFSLIHITKLN